MTITQDELDALSSEVRNMLSGPKLQKLEAELKVRSTMSLEGQHRYLVNIRNALEQAEVAEYLPEAKTVNGSNGVRKPDASNPFSAAGWNKTKQAEMVTRLGREKAESFAKSCGVTLGSTKPNPLFN